MKSLLSCWKYRGTPRRRVSGSRVGNSLENCEARTLLSGTAIFPAVASEVCEEKGKKDNGDEGEKKADPSAVPPAVYNGGWLVSSQLGSGTLTISQFGNKFEGSMILGVTSIDVFKGKIKGLDARAKTRGFVNGVKVTGKFNVTQFNFGLNFAGSISAKGGPFGGGATGNLNGTKVI